MWKEAIVVALALYLTVYAVVKLVERWDKTDFN
jgi:hypothetical protein